MALINNPNSWNGGTAVFNSNPITETYLKLAAHREAKNQAFDQYHQKQLENIDRQGVRDVDLPEFNKKFEEWNNNFQMNKDRMKKGDMMANAQNDKLFNGLMGYVQQSKARDAAKKDALQVGTTLKKENGTLPDNFLRDLDYNDRPLNDTEVDPEDKQPKSRRFNPVGYLGETAPWDIGKGMKKYEHIPADKVTTFSETDPNTGLRVPTTTEKFGDSSKQAIAAIAGSDYQNDPSFTKAVKAAVADPATKTHLEQVYQEQMGKTPEHPEEYATALILAQKAQSTVQGKPEMDKAWEMDQRQKQQIKLEGIKQKNREAIAALHEKNSEKLADYKRRLKGMDKDQQANALDAMNKDLEDEANKPENKWNIQREGKVIGSYKVAPVPQSVKNAFAVDSKDADGKKIKVYPTHFGYKPDGNVQIIFTSGGEGSDRMQIDKQLSTTITKNEFKAALGKGLGLGVKTVSGANYDGDDEENDNDEDDNTEVVPATTPAKSAAKTKKKIPGF